VGERKRPFFEPTFNRSVKVQEGTDRLTSDAGFLLARKADHRLGLTESLAADLRDPRQQYLIRYTMSELLRERIYSMMLGYRAQDDVDRLAHDPALRIATWNRLRERVVGEPVDSFAFDQHRRGGTGESGKRPRWPVSRWRATTTVRGKGTAWGTASSTRSSVAATPTLRKEACVCWTACWSWLRGWPLIWATCCETNSRTR
jgi:hypothetical protein